MNINIATIAIEGGTLLVSSLICNELLLQEGIKKEKFHNKVKKNNKLRVVVVNKKRIIIEPSYNIEKNHTTSIVTPLNAALFVAILHLVVDIVAPKLIGS